MNDKQLVDYGPLQSLIGTWAGDKGIDVAPDPDGSERNLYYESIVFSAIGDVTNAESQVLSVIHYRQIVKRISNHEVFHDETGYWMWDPKEQVVMHSLVIPRGVCLLAGGKYSELNDIGESVNIEVSASIFDKNWQIIQSPFMQENARTTEFHQKLIITNKILSFAETTMVEIYGKVFEHTDQNELIRQ
ncbi:MAG: DUF1794 domain-containing protein [Methyloprofundus sp.]|nr:DUF1794 domain-containing protein [Methyloprofundus sp.]